MVLIKYAFDKLLGILIYVIEYYVSLLQQAQDATIIISDLEPLLKKEDREKSGIEDGQFNGLSLNNLKISFPSKKMEATEVLIEVPTLTLRGGQKVGIIGPSGSGKSSILAALLNLVGFKGQYLINGKDVSGKSISPEMMALIKSTEPLFKISLQDNILLGRQVEEEKLKTVLAGLLVNEFIDDLTKHLGDREVNLSAGQEQRIRLARGLLQDSQVYLLDEPFNGLDQISKGKVISFLKEYLRSSSVVLVTHNRDELSLVDEVYELHRGILQKV